MKLDIPLIRQAKESFDCGLASIAMILKYHGIEKEIIDIKKELTIHKDVGSYISELGTYFLKQGFDANIVTMNPHLFTKQLENNSPNQLISHLKEKRKEMKQEISVNSVTYLIDFLEQGGIIDVKIPSAEYIKNEISQGRPLCSWATTNFLTNNSSKFNYHFNVITGIDNKNIYVNDPSQDAYGGKKQYAINDYLYAIHSTAHVCPEAASILTIKTNREKK